MGASTCFALRTENQDRTRSWAADPGFFREGPGRQAANSEIHYGAEGRRARLLPLSGLVTLLQDSARRAGTKSAGYPEAAARRRRHQLRFNGRAQELRRPAAHNLSASL